MIEPAQLSDRERILAISDLTFDEHHERLPDEFPLSDRGTIPKLLDGHFARSRMSTGQLDSLVLVCRRSGSVVGHIIVTCSNSNAGDNLKDRIAWVCDVSVLPDCRGLGLGPMLLARATEWAGQSGVTVIGGTVWGGNEKSERMFRQSDFVGVNTSYRKRISRPLPVDPTQPTKPAGAAKLRSQATKLAKQFGGGPVIILAMFVVAAAVAWLKD